MKKYGFGFSVMKKSTSISVGGVAPSPAVAPSISRIGNSIVCNKGTWIGTEPITYSYVFIRSFDGGVNFEVVQSSSSDTYNIVSSDNNALYRCNVVAANGISPNGFAASNDLNLGVIVPVLNGAPAISGDPFVSRTLSGTNGNWTNSPTSYTYQWQRSNNGGASWADISGASAITHVIQAAGSGAATRLRVIANNSFGSSDPAFSNTINVFLTAWDSYSTNAVLLWHNRLHRGAYYGGNIWEVRRTSDSALLNVGHDSNGEVNIAAAISHAGGVNRVVHSNTFNDASWSYINASFVSNNNPDPFGGNTAAIFQLSATYGVLQQSERTSLIPATSIAAPSSNYCLSIYAKKVNRNLLRFLNGTNQYLFNFDNPASSVLTGAGGSAGYETLSNGWFRIWVANTGSAINNFRLQGHDGGAAGDQFLVYGAHWNKGSSPTAYVATNAGPSGFAKVRTYYEQSPNARHAVMTTASTQDFCVVDGEAILENGEIVTARYESTHAGAASYSYTSLSIGSNSTFYDKYRRYTGNYEPVNNTVEHGGSNSGFNNDPSGTTYNISMVATNEYKVQIWNRAVPNGQLFRRSIVGGAWTAGTLLTNLNLTGYAVTKMNADFFNTWGRLTLRGKFMFTTAHDVSTMQAISNII